jgi:hypothetical protein
LGKTLIATTGVQHRFDDDTPLRLPAARWQQSLSQSFLREADSPLDSGDDLWQQLCE